MSQQRLLSPEEIAAGAEQDIPRLRLPDPRSLFSQRALRLRQRAEGHAVADYLRFVAQVAEAQQLALDRLGPVQVPDPAAVRQSADFGMPPLAALALPRDPAWHGVLREIVASLRPISQGPLADTLDVLAACDDDALERQAQALLDARPELDVAAGPIIAAALQVLFVRMVTTLGPSSIPTLGVPSLCPACGSRPVASVARIGGQDAGYRYLHCSLCALEWHRVRVQCTQCESAKTLHYLSIDDGRPARQHALKAECCDDCDRYLKILYLEHDPHGEPTADDLATLALDLLVGESGKRSCGVNWMLISGTSED